MPANKKYLSSPKQCILKTSAGILGGFLVTILLHNALGTLLENKAVLIITSAFSSFVVWASLLLVAFLFRNGWKVWGLYLLLSGIFLTIIFLH